jgi:hypothetical protein
MLHLARVTSYHCDIPPTQGCLASHFCHVPFNAGEVRGRHDVGDCRHRSVAQRKRLTTGTAEIQRGSAYRFSSTIPSEQWNPQACID